jgi:hypothetical protein
VRAAAGSGRCARADVSTSPKKIAVLFHEADRRADVSTYIVDHFARFWREDGNEVTYVFGTRRHEPADLLFVHVDLSVVPDEYLEFAAGYPAAVNGRVRDIRKSVTSRNLLRPGDEWAGPVLVKSDLNFGGRPERIRQQSWLQRRSRAWRGASKVTRRLTGRNGFPDWDDYVLFERLVDVPAEWFRRSDSVVEKFLPELEDSLYHIRMYQFLGDRWTCQRLASPHPVIKAGRSVSAEMVEPHPEVQAWRDELGMDYGKLDYLVRDDMVVLLDANKTTGASRHLGDDELEALRRHLAEGLYSFFD